MEKTKGFLAHDGRFFSNVQELNEYNKQQADDWALYMEEERAIDAALDYVLGGRL